jgi:hypothetical protein
MSIEDTNPVESVPDNLDDFEAALWPKEASPEPASSEVEDQEVEDDRDASEDTEDTHSLDNETVDSDVTDVGASDDDEDGETDEAEDKSQDEKPAKKKNRFQERIDEVVGKQREAERRLQEALAEIERLKTPQNTEPEPAKQEPVTETTGPTPSDLNEDGTQKYPLGEFDPLYIKDLMKYTLDTERAEREAEEARTRQERELQAAQSELETAWAEKLTPAQERYPDFQEKGLNLVETFSGLDPAYGEYLQTTLMSMEHGPDVLYYLANNVDEAQKIVNSGPRLATIALGRIEAKFAMAAEEKQRARPKVSRAPEPPSMLNKGSGVAKPAIKGDEDDLEAFSRALFKKK